MKILSAKQQKLLLLIREESVTAVSQTIYKSCKFYQAILPLVTCDPPLVLRKRNKKYNTTEYKLTLDGYIFTYYLKRLMLWKQ